MPDPSGGSSDRTGACRRAAAAGAPSRTYSYPLQPANALWNMGPVEATRCVLSYLKEKLSPAFPPDAPGTFESWVVGRFGRRLFEMFFKSYSEKLWGITCQELDADFAAQRIK